MISHYIPGILLAWDACRQDRMSAAYAPALKTRVLVAELLKYQVTIDRLSPSMAVIQAWLSIGNRSVLNARE